MLGLPSRAAKEDALVVITGAEAAVVSIVSVKALADCGPTLPATSISAARKL